MCVCVCVCEWIQRNGFFDLPPYSVKLYLTCYKISHLNYFFHLFLKIYSHLNVIE